MDLWIYKQADRFLSPVVRVLIRVVEEVKWAVDDCAWKCPECGKLLGTYPDRWQHKRECEKDGGS